MSSQCAIPKGADVVKRLHVTSLDRSRRDYDRSSRNLDSGSNWLFNNEFDDLCPAQKYRLAKSLLRSFSCEMLTTARFRTIAPGSSPQKRTIKDRLDILGVYR